MAGARAHASGGSRIVSGSVRQISAHALAEELAHFDAIIDVRTPLEYHEDHIPGAINLPVLSDEQRVEIGTLHRSDAFEARRLGAALISRNIADMLEGPLAHTPRSWRPLVYCWRGGQRSGSLAHVLAQVGWPAYRLDGGYKAWRRHIVEDLHTLPSQLRFVVLTGLTGCGKTEVLQSAAQQGAQVLDLEALARHRGSLLGALPDQAQPSQKAFEREIWLRLRAFDPAKPILVEAESRKIGGLHVPALLIENMRKSTTICLTAGMDIRVDLLRRQYQHFEQDLDLLSTRLQALSAVHGHAQLERWYSMAQQADWNGFVQSLLEHHYDPLYRRSTQQNFGDKPQGPSIELQEGSAAAIAECAAELMLRARVITEK